MFATVLQDERPFVQADVGHDDLGDDDEGGWNVFQDRRRRKREGEGKGVAILRFG